MKRKTIIIVALVLCLSMIAGCGNKRQQTFTVQIDSKQVSYLEAYCLGLGPRTVRMEDDPELVLALIEMFNGTYSYYDTWKIPQKVSGGGPYSITLYDTSKNEIMNLRFMDDKLYVLHKEGKSFDRYKNMEHSLDFASFYLTVYGYTG